MLQLLSFAGQPNPGETPRGLAAEDHPLRHLMRIPPNFAIAGPANGAQSISFDDWLFCNLAAQYHLACFRLRV
jgi:hypothetical protein